MSHYLQFTRCPKDYLYKDTYLVYTADVNIALNWVKEFLKKNNFKIIDNNVEYNIPHLKQKGMKP
jgi:hypothetical protein